jgi:CBS domain-containing protein
MIAGMKLSSVMTPKPVCAEAGRRLGEALELMVYHEVRQLPVVAGGALAGAVTLTDAKVARAFPFWADLTVGHVMNDSPWVVMPDTPLREVLDEMLRFKHEFALVAGDDGGVSGIFTRQDALGLLLRGAPPSEAPAATEIRESPLGLARRKDAVRGKEAFRVA